MATSMSLKNVRTPAPKWFMKTKKATSILVNGVIIILLALGYTENSLVMLLLKVGISTAMSALEAVIADSGDDEEPSEAVA
jgi:hypothetical protein